MDLGKEKISFKFTRDEAILIKIILKNNLKARLQMKELMESIHDYDGIFKKAHDESIELLRSIIKELEAKKC